MGEVLYLTSTSSATSMFYLQNHKNTFKGQILESYWEVLQGLVKGSGDSGSENISHTSSLQIIYDYLLCVCV